LFRGHGCRGCNGNGCHGCNGGCFGGLFRRHGCNGCNGCSGSVVCSGSVGCAGCGGTAPAPTKEMPKVKEKVPPPPKEVSAPATLVVTLPADATLTVDGTATTSTSERRTFITPALETGADYVYTLRAELVRDGRSIVETQQVTVRGGQTTQVPFNFSSQGVASR
jgi:uncharacterized protein (TIGR03000 family)